ncbi:adenosinetriphosphatase [Zalerion maritima]|uniref:DNA helicase n=1 Tax=Zalerion maritima TaxID=339359 RepID=A0AAD5RX14_9PEZI|nr:adenosinetriphosphatase [Zalerion maritima]
MTPGQLCLTVFKVTGILCHHPSGAMDGLSKERLVFGTKVRAPSVSGKEHTFVEAVDAIFVEITTLLPPACSQVQTMTGDAVPDPGSEKQAQPSSPSQHDNSRAETSPCRDDNDESKELETHEKSHDQKLSGPTEHGDELLPPPPTSPPKRDNANGELGPIDNMLSSGDSSDDLTPPPPSPPPGSDADPFGMFESANGGPSTSTPESPSSVADSDDSNSQDGANESDHDRPAKRRRLDPPDTPTSSPASRRPKPISPPWKKIEAEGPTTIIENGRRKSGRINTSVPVDMPPPSSKRPTRGTRSSLQPSPMPKKAASHKPPPKPKTQPTKTSSRKVAVEPSKSSKRRRSSSPKPTTPKRTAGTRRSSRNLHKSPEEPPSSQPRIRLRLRNTVIPITHPEIIARDKTAASFEEYFANAVKKPVEEGGLWDSEDGPEFTDEMAEREAEVHIRIEEEAQPGGMLSEERCSAFVPEAQEEPPRQWAGHDHLLKAMSNFRRLMVQEQQKHRQVAKRLAEVCRDEWVRRQPKTAEELEAEIKEVWIGKYRVVAKALVGTWENVRTEINRRRLEEWKMQEEKRVKAALNKAVNISEQKLQARKAHFGSEDELETDIDLEEGEDDEDDVDLDLESGLDGDGEDARSDNGESNMSSSEDEGEDKGDQSDEELTQEQLMQKYANLPGLQPDSETKEDDEVVDNGIEAATGVGEPAQPIDAEGDETSDESVDMDDDLGSSDDMDSDDDDDEQEEGDEEEDDDEPRGLLGLFFGKSELKKMQQQDASGEDEAKERIERDEGTEDKPATTYGETNGASEPAVEASEDVTMAGADGMANWTNDKPSSPGASKAAILSGGGGDEVQPANGIESGAASLGQKADAGKSFPAPTSETSPTESRDTLNLTNRDSSPRATNGDATVAAPIANGDVASGRKDISYETNGVKPVPTAADDIQTTPTVVVTPAAPHGGKFKVLPTSETGEVKSADIVLKSSRTEVSPVDVSGPTPASGTEGDASRSVSSQPGGPKIEVPFLLRGTLREYQHHGLDWLGGLYANKTNGILADEMGLGKTIQTIALLAHLACVHEVWGPHLVVVPTSVMLNWEMEFKKWCPGFKILSYYGSIEERKRKRQGWTNDDVWNVCITSYQLVLADQQVFKRRRWHYMILDEAHNIKNFKSQRWQTLLGFNTHSRLLLTGTPLQNNLTELWSLLFFLMPPENGMGGFADLQEFQDWFHRPEAQILESGRDQMDDEARAIIQKLHKVLRPYLLRRLKADVEKQMPAKYEHVEFCRLSKRQRELYDGFLARTDTRETLSSGNYLSIINCLMQLRKVCNHPDLFVDRPIMTSFRMRSSVPSEYDTIHSRVSKMLAEDPMENVSLGFLNLIPARYEHMPAYIANRIADLGSNERFVGIGEVQRGRAENGRTDYEPATVLSNISYLESTGRWGRLEELQHCLYVNAYRRQQKPLYGKRLIERLTIGIQEFPRKPRPPVPRKVMAWFEEESSTLNSLVQPLSQRADALNTTIQKFACVTPTVVTRDMNQVLLGRAGVQAFAEADLKLSAPVRYSPFIPPEPPLDPWHESRMRLSIQFPDKRLVQYDCGKLQALDKLLRRLAQGSHRALIFTQMTKVLDILEQFLNIHGHKYLRLDGATKIEQRQILTDRFNNDPRILCFILSTRSGGLGINLTGADTVIFYDQDWNPAMDKQCQDRCHRIGQTRDVHIYRLVSEHTIEANILRKASQKQMLDDVVIQEGEFTTDYFTKLSVQDVIGEGDDGLLGNMAANDAMDRLLGQSDNQPRSMGKVLEQAEDKEDVQAAHVAEKEIQADDEDFAEKPNSSGAVTRDASVARVSESAPPEAGLGASSAAGDVNPDGEPEYNAWSGKMGTVDDFMLRSMALALEGTPLELPKDKKKGRDRRKR